MSVHAPASQLAPARTAPATLATFHPRRPTVLSCGLGADSTAILLMFLADPAAHGLESDLSDPAAPSRCTAPGRSGTSC